MSRNTLLVLISVLLSACATAPGARGVGPNSSPGAALRVDASEEEDITSLMAQMRHDLSRQAARERELAEKLPQRPAVAGKSVPKAPVQTKESVNMMLRSLLLPIVGLRHSDLEDNWGEPRDGGKRRHKGIDIFAALGTELVAVADGYISYIGTQSKGGRCLWLVTDLGVSFYYAHLDRWAPGIYEGMSVKSGELLGYVGKTGNAQGTSAHLHFQIVENDETVNPYPILRGASSTSRAARTAPVLSGGFIGAGSR